MTTKLIGVKEFRKSITDFSKKARSDNVRYIVMNRNTPLFEIKPFPESSDLEAVVSDILAAKEDIAAGRLHTQKAILSEFT